MKDYRINILNSEDLWEFERNPKVTRISPTKFAREIASSSPHALAYQVKLNFRPFEASEDDDMPGIDDPPDVTDTDLINVPKRLRKRYRDFFSLVKAAKPTPHCPGIDHAIELIPGKEPPYMRTYYMSPAELKALEEYL